MFKNYVLPCSRATPIKSIFKSYRNASSIIKLETSWTNRRHKFSAISAIALVLDLSRIQGTGEHLKTTQASVEWES